MEDTWVDKIIDKVADKILKALSTGLLTILDTILGAISLGVIIYIVYMCIKFMYFSKSKDFENYLFGWLIYLLIRAINTVISVKLGG